MDDFDFSGYATKYDTRCSDRRVIMHGAFSGCDNKKVPLVYNHVHSDPANILGYAVLEDRPDGVYTYGSFNSTPNAQLMKQCLAHGDVDSLSIYANHLKQNGDEVVHGEIKEVSLVQAGANPGAKIDYLSFEHSDGSIVDSEDEAIIYGGELSHADDSKDSKPKDNDKSDDKDSSDESKSDDVDGKKIWDSFTEDEKNATQYLAAASTKDDTPELDDDERDELNKIVDGMSEKKRNFMYNIIGAASKSSKTDKSDDQNSDTNKNDTSEEEKDMKHNAFDDQDEGETTGTLSHSDLNDMLAEARKSHTGSLRHFFEESDYPNIVLAHADGDVVTGTGNQGYGINDIDYLFPEARNVTPTPDMITRIPSEWVNVVWNGVKHVPFSRIKSIAADLTKDDARAKGYIKGKQKQEEQFNLLYRKTLPQTVYKKQKLDRDDIIDITDFDVVAWLKSEMRMMLNEELSRAILVGDGRESSAEDKINEANIRPIFNDADVYTIKYDVTYASDATEDDKSNTLVDSAIKARKNYMGSGSPTFFGTNEVITQMMLARDKIGHRMYANEAELAAAMRVSRIVEVPVMEGITRTVTGSDSSTTTKELLGIIVNLNDYSVGSDRGGAISFFDDFDIDFNQQKYLIETRLSGCLTHPYSAITLETTKA